jgi:hypothetical protein
MPAGDCLIADVRFPRSGLTRSILPWRAAKGFSERSGKTIGSSQQLVSAPSDARSGAAIRAHPCRTARPPVGFVSPFRLSPKT